MYRFRTNTSVSTRAIVVLVLGLLGLNGCGILGIPAVILGHQELRAVEAGQSSSSSRSLALAGVILGYVAIAITLGVILFFAVQL